MLLNILTEPNSLLHQKAQELDFSVWNKTELKELAANMLETMYLKDGVGLAAPQIGKSIRLCVIAKNFTADKTADLVLINPTWQKLSISKINDEEGCLSVPDIYGQVKRYKKIRVKATDLSGQPLVFEAMDFFARIVQHEIDHLDGILFIEKAKKLHSFEKKL